MLEKIGTYPLTVEPFHTDFTGHITLGVLGNQLLNCAGEHATRRGFGMTQLQNQGYTWVLSRLALELVDRPKQYEPYTVQTWIESVNRLFTMRCFAILDAEGQPLGYARSIWAMIHRQTRRPVDLTTLQTGSIADYACPNPCPIGKPGHIKALDADARPVEEVRVRYSDIDTNGHVNSIRYLDHVLDLFPLDCYRRQRISRVEIAYLAESHYGDRLTLHCADLGATGLLDNTSVAQQTTTVEVRLNDVEPVCRCRLTFSPSP